MPSDQTGLAARCYSLSSAPHSGRHQITVKRTVDGYASNWICDNLREGDTMRVLPPSGIFTPRDLDSDLLLFAGGSGITPVMSITRTALEKGHGKVVLFYANRDEQSVIFAKELDRAGGGVRRPAGRRALARVGAGSPDAGAAAVVRVVLLQLHGLRLRPGAVHEGRRPTRSRSSASRATGATRRSSSRSAATPSATSRRCRPPPRPCADADDHEDDDEQPIDGPIAVEVELDGEHYSFDDWQGDKVLLEFLEEKGVDAPFSCREGNCSACACVVLEGEVTLKHNEVLDADDLADGIRLVCQSLPASEKLKITYNG